MVTRFRAYKLGSEGACFTHYNGTTFTMIEARLNDVMINSLLDELKECGKTNGIDKLHITSWDNDHCKGNDLKQILQHLNPKSIEYPGYIPSTENGRNSKKMIIEYERQTNPTPKIQEYNIEFLLSLSTASGFENNDVVFGPKKEYENSNDNSIVKSFRGGSFTVASLGDVEHSDIRDTLMNEPLFYSEVDVLILPHHGADNGFISPEFLAKVNPKVTISASNFGNKYDHPRPVIQSRCEAQGCFFATTKRGDVLVVSNGDSHYEVKDLYKDSGRIWKKENFWTKKAIAQG